MRRNIDPFSDQRAARRRVPTFVIGVSDRWLQAIYCHPSSEFSTPYGLRQINRRHCWHWWQFFLCVASNCATSLVRLARTAGSVPHGLCCALREHRAYVVNTWARFGALQRSRGSLPFGSAHGRWSTAGTGPPEQSPFQCPAGDQSLRSVRPESHRTSGITAIS